MIDLFHKKSPGNVVLLDPRSGGPLPGTGAGRTFIVRNLAQARLDARACFGRPLMEVRHTGSEDWYFRAGLLEVLPVFEIKGWEYLDRERFWQGVEENGKGELRPCLVHEVFMVWIAIVFLGREWEETFSGLFAEALRVDEAGLTACFDWAFGKAWAAHLVELAKAGRIEEAGKDAGALRWALKWQAFRRSGPGALGPVLSYWGREWALHRRPSFPWIAFLGPDGSGKSSVIQGVKDGVRSSGLKMCHVHWRPSVRKPLSEEMGPPLVDPHGRPPRGILLSIAALFLLMVRWWAGYLLRLWHRRSKSEVILSDRYYRDLLVDQRRYVYGGPVWLARWCFRFLPEPDFTFFLLTDAETILNRKAEVEKSELERQITAYRNLAESLGDQAVIVEVGRPLDEVVTSVREEIFRRFVARAKVMGARAAESSDVIEG